MITCEVLVLGAGPAGTAAAITASKAGLSTVVVERSRFPRHRPGETLHPGVEPLLRQLGVWDSLNVAGLARHPGVAVWEGDVQLLSRYGEDEYGEWMGVQLPRTELDATLLAAAAHSGCRVLQPRQAVAIVQRNTRVCGVKLDCGEEVRARWTVDATGGRHWLANRLGLPVERWSIPLAVRYGYAHETSAEINDVPIFRREQNGWTWMARVGENRFHWTRLRTAGVSIHPPDEFTVASSIGPIRGADVTWRLVSAAAGSGYLLTGDSLMVFDPSAANGVICGMMTGIMVGHLVARVHRGISEESEGAIGYSRWSRDLFQSTYDRMAGKFPELTCFF